MIFLNIFNKYLKRFFVKYVKHTHTTLIVLDLSLKRENTFLSYTEHMMGIIYNF